MVIETREVVDVQPTRLWFGLAGSAAAWLALGFIDLLIVWLECAYEEQYMQVIDHPLARAACFALAVVFFAIAVTSGITSYRSWRLLSGKWRLLDAPTTGRREFMAYLGVIVSITLAAGIVWLSLPPLIIEFCARTK